MQRRERIDAPLHVGERLAQQREQPRPVVEVCGLGKNFDARLQVRREAFHAVSRQSRGMLKQGKRGRSSSICSQGSRSASRAWPVGWTRYGSSSRPWETSIRPTSRPSETPLRVPPARLNGPPPPCV